jgi:hypothetical protein
MQKVQEHLPSYLAFNAGANFIFNAGTDLPSYSTSMHACNAMHPGYSASMLDKPSKIQLQRNTLSKLFSFTAGICLSSYSASMQEYTIQVIQLQCNYCTYLVLEVQRRP